MYLKVNENIINKIVTGKNLNQAKSINLSYRNRGKTERINNIALNLNNTNNTPTNNTPTFKNKIKFSKLKKIIIPYSPINQNANNPLEYSVLNPETNSDSPSAKSKGARLHSATSLINQIKNKGTSKKKRIIDFIFSICVILILLLIFKILKIKVANLIS